MGEIVLYEKIADPVEAIERMGRMIAKSQLFGCASEAQGQALVMMAMGDGVSITEMKRRYHIVSGRDLSMRADFMLAEFRRMGGEYTWIDDGEDGQKATIHVKYKTNDRPVSYTIDEAKQEGLIKDKSRWVKNPASMLRARAQTKAVRMVCPEVLAGFPTDEELGDFEANRQAVQSTGMGSGMASPVTHVSSTAALATSEPEQEPAEDAEFTQMDEPSMSAPIDGPCNPVQIEKIKSLLKLIAQSEGHADIGERLRQKLQGSGMAKFSDLSYQDAELLIKALSKQEVALFFDASLAGHSPGE